jgi:hypothetical protein
MGERVVKEKIAGAQPLHLAYFFNCCAIGKVTTYIHGIYEETVRLSVFLVPRLEPGNEKKSGFIGGFE